MISQTKYNRLLIKLLLIYLVTYVTLPKYLAFSVGFFYLSADRIILMVLLILYFFGILLFKRTFSNLGLRVKENKLVVILIVLICLLQLASIFNSADVVFSIKRFMNHAISALLPFFIILSLNRNSLSLTKLGNYILFSLFILTLILGAEIILERNVFENLLVGESLTDYQQQQIEEKFRGDGRRIQGTFANPLTLGHFILLMIPSLLFFKHYMNKNLTINLLIIALISLSIFVKSRTVFILIILFLLFTFYQFIKSKRVGLGSKILFVLVISLMSISILVFLTESFSIETFFGGQKLTEDSNRSIQIAMAIPLIANNWGLGYGFGMGAQILDFGTLGGKRGTIDNYFLTVILESGAFTFVLFVLFFIKSLMMFFKANRIEKNLVFGFILFLINLITLSVAEVHSIFYLLLAIYLSPDVYKSNSHHPRQLQRV